MKLLLILLTVAMFSLGPVACGGANSGADSASIASPSTVSNTAPAPTYAKADSDKDNDIGAPYDDTNNSGILNYGHAANATDERAIAALVKRYYATAVAGDGSKACSMIVSSLSKAVVEDYGHGSAGSPYLSSGKTCSAVMALLFKHSHSQLAAELPKLKVSHVRLLGDRGLAVLTFGAMPERQIPIGLEGHTWKVQALLDSELP